MSRCPSCGGVIGKDCYNPTECAQISYKEIEYDNYVLQGKINILIAELTSRGIPIPDLEPSVQQSESSPFNIIDDLPF